VVVCYNRQIGDAVNGVTLMKTGPIMAMSFASTSKKKLSARPEHAQKLKI
jgi:hypothetical protein